MNGLLRNIGRNFLQCKQLNCIAIAAASTVPINDIHMARERQKNLKSSCMKTRRPKKFSSFKLCELCVDLECRLEDLLDLVTIAEARYGKTWGNTLPKVHTLKQHGYSVPQMLNYHPIFSLGIKRLNDVLNVMKDEKAVLHMPPVEFHSSNTGIYRYLLYARSNTTEQPQSLVHTWSQYLSNKENVLRFFESKGVILNVENLGKTLDTMNYERLVALLAHIAELGVKLDELNMKRITRFIYYKNIFPKSQTKLHGEFYEYLEEQQIGKDLKDLIVLHEKDVMENLKLLKSHGFGYVDVAACPSVVCHSPTILVVYLESLPGRQELQRFKELAKDKKKVLNIIQFYIEKNHRFTVQVVKTESHAFML